MLRDQLIQRQGSDREGFRWRGTEVLRIEGFSDAVFAFALTLLVVSLEVPQTFTELLERMSGFPAFAICFAMLISIWYRHFIFFRRYGLQDVLTITYNAGLLFVVMFYVYPLKFMFNVAVRVYTGQSLLVKLPDGTQAPAILDNQIRTLFVVYGLGFIAVNCLLALLYLHAWRRRRELNLTTLEEFDTQSEIWDCIGQASVGAASILLALTLPLNLVGIAGLIYFGVGVVAGLRGAAVGKRRALLIKSTAHSQD